MKKHRFVSLLLVFTLIVSLLTGCHGAKESTAFSCPEEFDTSRSYELTFWAKNDTNRVQQAIYARAIEDFEALYPNIRINLKLYTDYVRLYNDVITNIATNTTPNICITYPDHIATYLSGDNTVVPLDDLMNDASYGLSGSKVAFESPSAEEIIPEFLEECVFAGHTYALPFVRSTEACYVNKTYVEALGYDLPDTLTWDFVWEVSEAATKKNADGTYALTGQNVMLPFIYKSTDNFMITYLRQAGAGYSTDAGDVELFNETTTDFLKTITAHAATRAFSTFKISGYPANFLNAGQCIFAIDSTAGATWMGSGAPLVDIPADQVVEFETVVMTVPQLDPDQPQMISQGPSVCLFNKEDPQEVLASWLFLQYLLTNDVQIAYAETEGYVPVTLTAQNSAEYAEYLSLAGTDSDHYEVKIAATRLLLDNTENTFVTAVFNGSASLREAAGALIEDVVKGTIRKKTVDDAYLENLYDSVSTLYHLDSIHAEGRTDLGPLPGTAKALLGSLAAAWILMGVWQGVKYQKTRKKKRSS